MSDHSTDEIHGLIDALVEALVEERLEDAQERAEDIVAWYRDRGPLEELRANQARRLTAQQEAAEPDQEEDGTLEEFLETYTQTQLERSNLLLQGFGVVERLLEDEETDGEDIAEELEAMADTAKAAEDDLSEVLETAESEIEAATLPAEAAALSVLVPMRTLEVGEESPVFVTAGNAGDEAATDVGLSVESGEGLSVTAEESLGELGAEETVQREYSVEATASGDAAIRAKVTSENAGSDTTQWSVTVPNPLTAYASEEGVVETEGLREAVDDWRAGDIETGLLRDAVDAWRSGEPVE